MAAVTRSRSRPMPSPRPGGGALPCRRTPATGRAPHRAAGVPSVMPTSTRPRRGVVRRVGLRATAPSTARSCASLASTSSPPARTASPARRSACAGRRSPRALASRASAASHDLRRATSPSGSCPWASRTVSGTVNSGAPPSPCSRSIEARWRRMSSIASGGTRSRTIATDVPRSAACAQQVPRHRVGVASGGGHEEPQVGGGRAAGSPAPGWRGRPSRCRGRRAAPAPGAARRGDQPHGRRVVTAGTVRPAPASPTPTGGAGQPGEDPRSGEPAGVRGVVDQHRRAGGRPQHTGARDRRADQGVDQRGLAGAGGAADDREQRRVQRRQPREDVVVQLLQQRAPACSAAVSAPVRSSGSAACCHGVTKGADGCEQS